MDYLFIRAWSIVGFTTYNTNNLHLIIKHKTETFADTIQCFKAKLAKIIISGNLTPMPHLECVKLMTSNTDRFLVF